MYVGQPGQGCKPILRADMVLQTYPCTVVPDMPCILTMVRGVTFNLVTWTGEVSDK